MAANSSVLVVLTPNGRRESVKVTPNTSILQVLEDVCQKQNLDPSEWDLKHYNRIVELANSVRFSGLPNKATLEMVQNTKPRKESTINLGLQLEAGKRLMGTFSPNQTLWDVIKHWEGSGEANILHGTSETNEVSTSIQPVCVYMRQEIVGQEELAKRTLRSLGLTHGSACIRFLHRSEDQLKYQANVSAPLSRPVLSEQKDDHIPEPVAVSNPLPASTNWPTPINHAKKANDVSENQRKGIKNTASAAGLQLNNFDTKRLKLDEDSDKMEVETGSLEPAQSVSGPLQSVSRRKIPEPELIEDMEIVEKPRISKKGDLHIIGEHDAVVYHRDDVSGPSNYHIPDDFFELTRGDVESIYRTLVAKRRELEDAPLTTTTLKQQEHDNAVLRNLKEHPVSVIRVRFPDRLVLQGIFRGVDSVGALEKFVRTHLAKPEINFYLYTSPPKTVLQSDQRLVEQNLIGNAVVYFGSHDPALEVSGTQLLSPDLYNKLSCPDAINEYLQSKGKQQKPNIDSTSMIVTQPASTSGGGSTGSSTLSSGSQPGPSSSSRPAPVHHNANNTQKVPKWFKSTK